MHIENIYPQTPREGQRWEDHDSFVTRLGNLTLLGGRLNEQIKNSDFETKKQQACQATRLTLTERLLRYERWSPEVVLERQNELGRIAQEVWPAELLP